MTSWKHTLPGNLCLCVCECLDVVYISYTNVILSPYSTSSVLSSVTEYSSLSSSSFRPFWISQAVSGILVLCYLNILPFLTYMFCKTSGWLVIQNWDVTLEFYLLQNYALLWSINKWTSECSSTNKQNAVYSRWLFIHPYHVPHILASQIYNYCI